MILKAWLLMHFFIISFGNIHCILESYLFDELMFKLCNMEILTDLYQKELFVYSRFNINDFPILDYRLFIFRSDIERKRITV